LGVSTHHRQWIDVKKTLERKEFSYEERNSKGKEAKERKGKPEGG
jgi:hypothetical protein